MEITKSNKIIIKDIMYSVSIAITPFSRDDSITAQLLHCFQSHLWVGFSRHLYYTIFSNYFNIFIKMQSHQIRISQTHSIGSPSSFKSNHRQQSKPAPLCKMPNLMPETAGFPQPPPQCRFFEGEYPHKKVFCPPQTNANSYPYQ